MVPEDLCAYEGSGCPFDFINIGSGCCEQPLTPIVIDVSGQGFSLTDAAHGVDFDFFGSGKKVRMAWTERQSENAWLVFDRNGDGLITSGRELFGNVTAQPPGAAPNGFRALAEFDKLENGGNGDGVIDAEDAIFPALRLWFDRNHDGVSQPGELVSLDAVGIDSISLDYKETRVVDRYGNRFRYRARVDDERHTHVGRFAYDVFLTRVSQVSAVNATTQKSRTALAAKPVSSPVMTPLLAYAACRAVTAPETYVDAAAQFAAGEPQ